MKLEKKEKWRTIKMKTYVEVGLNNGLRDEKLSLYVAYMKERWESTEVQKCSDGYANEWAYRFLNDIEYNASDSTGKQILESLSSKYKGKSQ
jgi:hypothetical protein